MNRFCSRLTIFFVVSFSLLFQQQMLGGKKDQEVPLDQSGKLTFFQQTQESPSLSGLSVYIETRTHQASRIQPIDARMERMNKKEMEKEIEWLLTTGRSTLCSMIETENRYPGIFDKTPKRKAIFKVAKAQFLEEQAQEREKARRRQEEDQEAERRRKNHHQPK